MTSTRSLEPPSMPPLFELRSGVQRPAVIVCPDYGGSVMYARPLVSHLPENVGAFGLRIQSTLIAELEILTLRRLARHLAETFDASPLPPPYHLIGHSFGGFLAFETAVELERMGVEVGLVGLLDPILVRRPNLRSRAGWARVARAGWKRVVRSRAPEAEPTDSGERRYPRAHADVLAGLKGMLDNYSPSRLQGDATLFRASDEDECAHLLPDLGWSKHVGGSLRIVATVGDHLSMIRDPSHAHALAGAVVTELARFASAGADPNEEGHR